MKTYKTIQKCTKMYKIVQILSENQQFPTIAYGFLCFPTFIIYVLVSDRISILHT